MHTTQKIEILFRLGNILRNIAKKNEWPGYDSGINQEEYNQLQELAKSVHIYNGWFTEESVLSAFKGVSIWLEKSELNKFVESYSLSEKQKTVAIIMAGNIPMVGWHDLICVFLSGHKAVVKLSSDDDKLIPALVKIMALFDESINDLIKFADGKLENFDAVIATGSDNSTGFFNDYFGKYPHIIRKHRTSVAILNGDETVEDIKGLGHDIFDFHGLGCRNVSKIFIPRDFELKRFFEGIFDFNPIIHHHKYANNYDYNKAVYLMNQVPILDNNFLMLKEDDTMYSPLGVLLYEYYDSIEALDKKLLELDAEIQVVVGKGRTQFGQSQQPEITDFADGIDTMKFLSTLS